MHGFARGGANDPIIHGGDNLISMSTCIIIIIIASSRFVCVTRCVCIAARLNVGVLCTVSNTMIRIQIIIIQ
jgi:hypothetical protein